jgi:hypothetical protein
MPNIPTNALPHKSAALMKRRGRGPSSTPLPERFWSKVDKRPDSSQCWLWTGYIDAGGRGRFNTGSTGGKPGKIRSAHRIAYELTYGPIEKGMEVCHHCDNPPCCNPAHLFLGTHMENMIDRDTKGRNINYIGTQHGMSKLTEDSVREMRYLRAQGATFQAIARRFGVSKSVAHQAITGVTWKHVE